MSYPEDYTPIESMGLEPGTLGPLLQLLVALTC